VNRGFKPFAALWTSVRSQALFWLQVNKSDDGCWEWKGTRHRQGYGLLTVGGRPLKAHRAAFFLANGYMDTSMKVLHSCDNPPCVNPAHLRLGTQAENVADMVAKGRNKAPTWMVGQLNPMSWTNRRKREEFRHN
jgi:hypothetical protein